LHLTRNAAASINGLQEGWRHHGFYSHKLPTRLNIVGYSDGPAAWGMSWWKFDLPPGWQEWTDRPLVDVCAFQWRSAHQAILDETQRVASTNSIRLKFEDLIGEAERRDAALTSLSSWLGIPEASLVEAGSEELPLIMTTSRPRKRRWTSMSRELAPALDNPGVRRLMKELGYDGDVAGWL
jgi:hypothetical protein